MNMFIKKIDKSRILASNWECFFGNLNIWDLVHGLEAILRFTQILVICNDDFTFSKVRIPFIKLLINVGNHIQNQALSIEY
jgi:hypothetical protein